jgi:hypothetical protein
MSISASNLCWAAQRTAKPVTASDVCTTGNQTTKELARTLALMFGTSVYPLKKPKKRTLEVPAGVCTAPEGALGTKGAVLWLLPIVICLFLFVDSLRYVMQLQQQNR